MKDLQNETENKILESAKDIFVRKGFDGARMQEIALHAKINKALLHYYFRTKEKLFIAVFRVIFKKFIPKNLMAISDESIPVFEKIRLFSNSYIDMLVKNPFIPLFVLQEIHRNPDRLFSIFHEFGINPELFIGQIKKEMDAGIIRQMDPRQIMVNLVGLCIFPIAAKPLLQRLFFGNDKSSYNEFLEARKKDVAEFIIHSIKA